MIDEPTTQRDEESPIGEMNLPGRPMVGARAMALAGTSVSLGVAGMLGVAYAWTPTTPPLLTQF